VKRKLITSLLAITIIITAVICALYRNIPIPENESENRLNLYKGFLAGEQSAEFDGNIITINDIFEFNDEKIKSQNQYALFDMNGDGLPELHLRSVRLYYILTVRDNKLVIWCANSAYAKPLNNGAIIHMRPGGAPPHESYIYIVLDFYGNELLRLYFEKYDSDYNGIYDENDLYLFEKAEVSKADWDKLTEKYFSIGYELIEWRAYNE